MTNAFRSLRRPALLTALSATAIAIGVTGCCQTKHEGRCGIADMCDPVVMPDPLPYDRCVPPKGVDCGSYGYNQTSWRVLIPQGPDCCPTAPCYEHVTIPVGAEQVDFHALLSDEAPLETLAVVPIEASSVTDPSRRIVEESVDVVRSAYGIDIDRKTTRR